jgi:hypothetical protein
MKIFGLLVFLGIIFVLTGYLFYPATDRVIEKAPIPANFTNLKRKSVFIKKRFLFL